MSDPQATRATRVLRDAGRPVEKRRRVFALDAPDGRHRFEGPRVRIGAHPGNELVVADDTVSRLHAQIDVEDEGFRLRDRGSRNGVAVDGLRVVDAYLRPGAEIRLGRARLRFRLLDEEVQIGRASCRERVFPVV